MPTRGRGRAESLALRVLSPGGSTTVVLQSRTDPKKPLAGCDVYAYPPDNRNGVRWLGRPTGRAACSCRRSRAP